jgi:hypothetical protein
VLADDNPPMNLDPRLEAASSDDDLAWIVEGVLPFGAGMVGTLVPVRFEAYARILHPAWRAGDTPVRWDAVAAWSGRTVHSLAEFVQVASPIGQVTDRVPFDQQPMDGALPRATLRALRHVLLGSTTTPNEWFVGIWEGYGWFDPEDVRAPRLRLPQRTHLVFNGDADLLDHVGWVAFDGHVQHESPSVIWPADRAWFVATDVDQESTYVGGSEALVSALVAAPGLEAWRASAIDSITVGSDTINR